MLPRPMPLRATSNAQGGGSCHPSEYGEQLSLIDSPEAVETLDPAAPECLKCSRPAVRRPKHQGYGRFCGVGRCLNRERICRTCDGKFLLGTPGAGTGYCSKECRVIGYNRTRLMGSRKARLPAPIRHCSWCGEQDTTRFRARKGWPFICPTCLDPISHVVRILVLHHVSPERAQRLLTDPGCEVCGVNLLERVRISRGIIRPRLVVDHDHACCPHSRYSCGKCVRGLICSPCNTAAGMLGDDVKLARVLASYLDAWMTR